MCHRNTSPAVRSRRWESNPTTSVWGTGVSPQHFACLVVSLGDRAFDRRRRPGARPVDLAWVGWESNPRYDGLRVRYKASVCYRPAGPTLWNRTRASRLSTERANTSYARVGRIAPRTARMRPCVALVSTCGCLPGHPHHRHRSSVVRERPSARAGRTSGRDATATAAVAPVAD